MGEAGKMDNKISTFEEKIEKLSRIISILEENGVLSGDISLWETEDKKKKYERQLNAIKYMDESKMEPRKLGKHFELHIEDDASFTVRLTSEATNIIYDNAISSYSGMYEWTQEMVDDVYSFISGNHPNNYALGTTTLKELLEGTTEDYLKDPSEESFERLVEMADVVENYFLNNVYGKKISHIIDSYVEALVQIEEEEKKRLNG